MICLAADASGQIVDLPGVPALGQNGIAVRVPENNEMIPMPEGGHLYFLPDRKLPNSEDGLPVAAILPQGYTRTLLPAYRPTQNASWLPYFGYAACAFSKGQIYVAALPTQPNPKWDPKSFSPTTLRQKIASRIKRSPNNRVLNQLARCASEYHCYTAANIFFKRWEGALPVSPSCNSVCRGCISKADDPGPPSPQERFDFVPTLEECVQVVREHFSQAEDGILSFGQGCEGEPSLQSALIEKILLETRAEFPHGQFHMNTNGSRPRQMEKLFKTGLNSIRVSLNSVQETWYNAYYRPKNYAFDELRETIRIAKQYGVHVSLNLLCFPGVTDHPREIDAFSRFLESSRPNLIQLRNLNIDPLRYLEECIQEKVIGIGMAHWIKQIKHDFPSVAIGNFTPYVKGKQKAC